MQNSTHTQEQVYIETQENQKSQIRKANSEAKELDRQQKKYSSKSYKEQFAYLAIFLTAISFFCNAWSLYTSFPYINSQLHLISDSETICNVFSILIISIVELLIIFSVPNALAIFVQKGWNIEAMKQAGFYLVIGLCCFSSTLFFSYHGSYKTAANKIGEPVYIAPVAKTEKDINRHYDSAIQSAEKNAKLFYKNRVYLGKLQKSEQLELNGLNAITADLRAEKIKAINNIQGYNEAATATAKKQHNEAMKEFNMVVLSDGGNLVNYTLTAAIILIFCYFFREKYDYNTYSERSIYMPSAKKEASTLPNAAVKLQILETKLQAIEQQNQFLIAASATTDFKPTQGTQLAKTKKHKTRKKKEKQTMPEPQKGSFLDKLRNPTQAEKVQKKASVKREYEKKCLGCSKNFSTYKKNKRHCSSKCYQKSYREKAKKKG